MYYYLETLWRYLEDAAPVYRQDGEYGALMRQVAALEDELKKELTEEGWRRYERLSLREGDLTELDRRESFLLGFRVGARIMLDVTGEHRGETFMER